MLHLSKSLSQRKIPSIYDLIKTKLDNDEILNIDDGLSSPENNQLFLLASMMFLQKQLYEKLGIETVDSNMKNKLYSDMLLFEKSQTNQKDRERYYIRVKNSEKYDKIRKSEISIPDCSLSKDQILPQVKKQKLKPKIFLSKIFKLKLKRNKSNLIDSSEDVESKSQVHGLRFGNKNNYFENNNETFENKIETYFENKNENYFENKNEDYFVKKNEMYSESMSSRSEQSQESSMCARSINCDKSVIVLHKSINHDSSYKRNVKLKEQSSKLSVCVEDESNTDTDSESSSQILIEYSINSKSKKFSSDV